jgi:Holliday junction DNA helicase RuvA
MFAYLEGILIEKNPAYTVIDCNGVGYHVQISLNTFVKLPEKGKCKVFTHLSVKEDAHILYGFAEESERTMFRQLISVSGIGETTARLMLSSLSPPDIEQAIVTGNVSKLQSVKGIGEKSAQRIIVDLRNKITKGKMGGLPSITLSHNKLKDEALNALDTLGFGRAAAEKAVDRTLGEVSENILIDEFVKKVLKNI